MNLMDLIKDDKTVEEYENMLRGEALIKNGGLIPALAKLDERIKNMTTKTLHNSDVSKASHNVPDLKIYGDGDMFQLLCKASSKAEGWMKSTKAMQIDQAGCLLQVTTQQGENVSEALTFIPGVKIVEDIENEGRKLVII